MFPKQNEEEKIIYIWKKQTFFCQTVKKDELSSPEFKFSRFMTWLHFLRHHYNSETQTMSYILCLLQHFTEGKTEL